MEQQSYKKRHGDRREGRWLRTLDAVYSFMPFIMKTRGDATNYFSAAVELTAAEKFIRRKRDEGLKGFGMLHIFIAGYVRTVSQYPAVNRFIVGRRIYARDNIEVVMTIKKRMSSSSGEAEFKVCFNPSDTISTVYERVNAEIEKIRNDETVDTEKVASFLGRLPRPLLNSSIKLVEWLDYHGWLPEYVMKASPFHGSLVITDLGSLGIPPVFHHLYNIGTVPIFIAFGTKRKAYGISGSGEVHEKKYLDYTVSTDERICDGYYFAVAFKYLDYILRNPEVLENPPEVVVGDVD